MPDQQETERLEATIRTRYPYPLAASFLRAYYEAPEPVMAHDYLMNLFEVTLKYLTTIALAQYFKDGINDPKINSDLQRLQRPSLGHWQGWLRDILDLYRREGRTLAVPALAEFYNQKHPEAIPEAFVTLDAIVRAKPITSGGRNVTTRQFFEVLGQYRNWVAHGVAPSPQDRERAAEVLAPAMRALYGAMGFVADYRLVFIKEVTVDYESGKAGSMRFGHKLTYLSGDRPRLLNEPQILTGEALRAKELYLLDNTPQFAPLLSLHPFWVFRRCDTCASEEAFVLNESDGRSLEYLSYQTGDRFNPTEYVDYMQSLLQGLKNSQPGATPAEPSPLPQPAPIEPPDASVTQHLEPDPRAYIQPMPRPEPNVEARLSDMPSTPQPTPVMQPIPPQWQVPPDAPTTAQLPQRSAPWPLLIGGAAVLLLLALVGVLVLARGGGSPPATSLEPTGVVAIAQPATPTRVRIEPTPLGEEPTAAPTATTPQQAAAPTATTALIAAVTATVEAAAAAPTATGGATIPRWNTGVAVTTLEAGIDTVLTFSPDSKTLVSGYYPGTVDLWNMADGSKIRTLQAGDDVVSDVAFSPDGKLLAAGGRDHNVRIWNAADGTLLETLPLSDHSYNIPLAFSPDGQLLAASDDDSINLYTVADGKLVNSLKDLTYAVNTLAISPDGKLLIAGMYDYGIRVWSMETGELIRTLTGHTDLVDSVSFSPDGATILSSGDDTIRLWNAADGTPIRTMEEKDARVWQAVYSADSKTIAAVANDGTTRLWNPADGTQIASLQPGGSAVALSPDGAYLASSSDGGGIAIWKLADVLAGQ